MALMNSLCECELKGLHLEVLLVRDGREVLTNTLVQATRTKRHLQAKGTQTGNPTLTGGRTEMNTKYPASTKRIVKRSLKWSEHHSPGTKCVFTFNVFKFAMMRTLQRATLGKHTQSRRLACAHNTTSTRLYLVSEKVTNCRKAENGFESSMTGWNRLTIQYKILQSSWIRLSTKIPKVSLLNLALINKLRRRG